MTLTLGLPLSVPTADGKRHFIKSVELMLGPEVVGELYVHSARWQDSCDTRAARREARTMLRRLSEAGAIPWKK